MERLQRHHKRFSAIVVQVTSLRDTITKHWDLLGYSVSARGYFADMMNVPDAELSYKTFRAHEKEVERLKRYLLSMRILTSVRSTTSSREMNCLPGKLLLSQYVVKREEIAQAAAV